MSARTAWRHPQGQRQQGLGDLCGIWGRPYIDLTAYIDTAGLAEIDEEVSWALTEVPVEYTGGSHKTMGIVPPSLEDDPYIDYGQVIAGFDEAEFRRFVALGEHPERFDAALRQDYEFGEEREHPLSRRQMLYLKVRYGVYFPWKVFYEMIPTLGWEDKSHGVGKGFTAQAQAHFPRTVALVRRLPFAEIGRCNIMGLEANDHGTVHRDGEPDEKEFVGHFITLCPRRDKRLFLWDEEARRETYVRALAYWFNDSDYHGVAADPYFRYSIRVDGVFQPGFLRRLERDHGVRGF